MNYSVEGLFLWTYMTLKATSFFFCWISLFLPKIVDSGNKYFNLIWKLLQKIDSILSSFFYILRFSFQFWTLGKTVCKASSLISLLNLNCSILFLIVVVLDRTIIAKFTLKVIKWRTVKRAQILSIYIWILAILLSFPAWQNRSLLPKNVL